MTTLADAIVIGGGIAGLSVAAALTPGRRIVVLESERALAQHSTGRSAAVWIAGYGGPRVHPYAKVARRWYESRADGAAGHELLGVRGMLVVAERSEDEPELDGYLVDGAERVHPDDALSHFPPLRPEVVLASVWDPSVTDIDVMEAVAVFRRTLAAGGAAVETVARVERIDRTDGDWVVGTSSGSHRAPLVVNAAGAWADHVASLAGLPPLGLQPFRRTMCTFDAPSWPEASSWPLLLDAGERFYMKPEGAGFMASPADETPQPPGDARPVMDDVAVAVDLVERFTGLETRSIRSSWAGLRTFAPDRSLVLGPDPAAVGFAWCAGGGGFGIMTAPAAGRSVAALVDTGALPDDVIDAGGDAHHVLPDRLRQ